MTTSASVRPAPTGHPRGLYILFATEMWERFSYYGMRVLLVLYLINALEWQPGRASAVYKWYTSLVYLTPLLGGYLADRKLGLRASILVGGILMAIGHFLMAVPSLTALYLALGCLILGNGFFKPNISTLVGKMYTTGSPRRDGAFTIFYMGINVGAFGSPLVCGWLRIHYGYHYGFAAAGVGMLLGLGAFLLGQRRVLRDVEAAGNVDSAAPPGTRARNQPELGPPAQSSAGNAETAPDADTVEAGAFAGAIASFLPRVMVVVGFAAPGAYAVLILQNRVSLASAIMPVAFALVAAWMGRSLQTIQGVSRDRSTVIFVLFAFSVLFWMAFEQAGNALNIWADAHTRLSIGSLKISAEPFQSLNPLMIFALAPAFSSMWVWMARRNIEPSTPTKMLVAMVLVAASFGVMVVGAMVENQTVSSVSLERLPPSVHDMRGLDAGRMWFEPGRHELRVRGVLAPFAVTDALARTLDREVAATIDKLDRASQAASKQKPVVVAVAGGALDNGATQALPATFAWASGTAEAGLGITWDPTARTLSFTQAVDDKARAALVAASAEPSWRVTLRRLAERSQTARVSGGWLFASYLFATLGELCLSPVGLSLVTKLAPLRFASLFMGVWHLSSSVAQYVGGSIGESWGQIPPSQYFAVFVWTSLGGALVLALLVRPLNELMHGVH